VFLSDVVGKQNFDPEGLVLAFRDGAPVAFAHAGFKTLDFVNPNPMTGTVCMLAVGEGEQEVEVAVLAEAVRYLLGKGARQVQAFAMDELFLGVPFYACLYGAEKAGMDELHPHGHEALTRGGFRIGFGSVIMRCMLRDSYPPVRLDGGFRLQIEPWDGGGLPLALRHTECYGIPEPMRRAYLVDEQGARKVRIAFWHLERYNRASGDHAAVISAVGADRGVRGTGAAVTLLQEVLRIVQSEGATSAVQCTLGENGRAVSFYRKLGFEPLRTASTYYLDWRRYGEYA
jgi:GNAT superfamily N-acetyltransferase